jgi:hypothetical protein
MSKNLSSRNEDIPKIRLTSQHEKNNASGSIKPSLGQLRWLKLTKGWKPTTTKTLMAETQGRMETHNN